MGGFGWLRNQIKYPILDGSDGSEQANYVLDGSQWSNYDLDGLDGSEQSNYVLEGSEQSNYVLDGLDGSEQSNHVLEGSDGSEQLIMNWIAQNSQIMY